VLAMVLVLLTHNYVILVYMEELLMIVSLDLIVLVRSAVVLLPRTLRHV